MSSLGTNTPSTRLLILHTAPAKPIARGPIFQKSPANSKTIINMSSHLQRTLQWTVYHHPVPLFFVSARVALRERRRPATLGRSTNTIARLTLFLGFLSQRAYTSLRILHSRREYARRPDSNLQDTGRFKTSRACAQRPGKRVRAHCHG